MKVGLFTVSSTLANQPEVGEGVASRTLNSLMEFRRELEVSPLLRSVNTAATSARAMKDEICGAIVVVATGGTERCIEAIATNLEVPVLILANPFHNSLASSQEAYAFLREEGRPVKLLYSRLDSSTAANVGSFIRICETIEWLKRSKFGLVGKPSPWILTGGEASLVKDKIGPEVVQLEVAELLDLIGKVGSEKAKGVVEELKNKYGGVVEPSEDDLLNAARVYLAMRKLASNHGLLGATFRCFDLLEHNLTCCIGVSLCNDLGIVTGCEADLEAMLTMMIVSLLTCGPCWMANVARVDEDANTVTLAHCTIASRMLSDLKRSALRSHFESGKCVSVQGPLAGAEVTLARLGGKLRKMLVATGRIAKSNMRDPSLCRTQAEVRLDGRVEDFLDKSLGNHQILAYGNLRSLLLDFCRFKGVNSIVI